MALSWEQKLDAFNQQPRRWLTVLAFLLAIQISPHWYPTPDGCSYLSIARSIAAGGMPTNLGSRQLYYAPGYPLLISPAFLFSDRPFLLLSIMQWLLTVVFMLGVYQWSRRLFPPAALVVTALATVNVEFWCLYRRTLSEIAFMAVLIWLVNLLNAALTARSSRDACVRILLGSLLLAGLVAIRQAGIVFAAGFGAAMIVQACRGRVRWFHAVAGSLVVGIPATFVFLGIIHHDRELAVAAQSVTYVDHITNSDYNWMAQLIEGIRLRISEIGRITIPGMYKSYARRGDWLNVNMAIYVAWSSLLLAAWWRLVRQSKDVFALTLPFYAALYVVWPFDQATRFFVPLVPLLMTCVWLVFERWQQYRMRILTGLLAAHGAVAIGYWVGVDAPRARKDNAQWAAVEQLAAPIRANGGPVLALHIRDNTALMLQYVLDRHLREARDSTGVPADVDWVILSRGVPVFQGFRVYSRAGKYQLVCRKPDGSQAARRFSGDRRFSVLWTE